MKKSLLTLVALALASAASAQIVAFKQGTATSVEAYSLPRTVITATITVEREVILRGPYARFASQYLGISTAAMADKESFKLINAQLGFSLEPDPKQVFAVDEKSGNPINIFTWLIPTPIKSNSPLSDRDFAAGNVGNIVPFKNLSETQIYGQTSMTPQEGEAPRMSAVEKSPEQMAADAAELIFRIRKKRVELITGEIGDAVYGEGLKAALAEMNRIESEYVSLFIGKRHTQLFTKVVSALPEAGKNRITICRFSDAKGVVADTDVSGRPINVELTPEKSTPRVDVATKKTTRWITYRVPLVEDARLTDGTEVLSTLRIPVYQAGSNVEVPVVLGL